MGLNIRDATAADAAEISALLADLDYPTTVQAAEEGLARFRDDPASRLQVAESEAGVVGLVATHIVPRLDGDRLTCRITDIVVSVASRRRGIGSALIAAAEREAHSRGAPRLDLSSGDWRSTAHGFYMRTGFETRSRGFTKALTGLRRESPLS